MERKPLWKKTIILVLFMTVFLSACDLSNSTISTDNPDNQIFAVDRIFRTYYKELGGKEILGVAISELISWEENQCQYTEKALMCLNQNNQEGNGFFLFPLGAMIQIENRINHNNDTDIEYELYSEFQPYFQQLGGEAVVGKPITNIRYNGQEQRIEQYFENVGFYQLYHDRTQSGLLSYGVSVCQKECKFSSSQGTSVNLHADTVELPFLPFLARMNKLDAMGAPITAPIEVQPGLLQQVFENVVLIGNPTLQETIHLLDLPVRLNYRQEKPGPQIYSVEENMVFYMVSTPNGFHVPIVFDDFIMQNGGREFSGNPLCEVYQDGDKFRQCFQNYCLDYEPDSKDVRMAALGEQFLGELNVDPIRVVKFDYSPQTVALNIKEKSPNVSIDEEQELEILVLKTENQSPLQNIEAKLEVTLPNGDRHTYQTQPTDEFGTTNITIPAFRRVQNGSVITYSVCLLVPSDQPICVNNSYLIW
ncbi:MAG TPA: hypothetical protein VK856_05415 [Anaerolineaceae bacterium]|nr:hypothetical protein [Anaerolineaceae bacterium]